MIHRYYSCALRTVLLFAMTIGVAAAGAAGEQYAESGSPYGWIVREIRIQGLRACPEALVRNQLASQVNRVYTAEVAEQDLRWLDRLGVFASVRESATIIGGDVVLTVDVVELPGILPFPTLNITDENGASGGFGAGMPNLLHSAVALSGSFKLGGLTEIGASVQAPWRLQRREWYSVNYNYRDRINQLDDFRENSHELDMRMGISLYPDWMLSGKLGYMSMGSNIPGVTLSPGNRDNIPALGAVLEYDGRDSSSMPRRGWQGIFDVTQNGGFLGGDGDFVTTQLDVRRYQPLAGRHGLAIFSYATLQSGVVGRDVPVYRDFKIGGTNTVRGWNSGARRGNNQFINTLEYRFEVLPPKAFRAFRFDLYAGMQLVAFADVGTAWSYGSDFTRNVIAGGGFGLHFLVPFVDTVRFDFGFGQSGTGIHPNIHIREKAYYSRNRIR